MERRGICKIQKSSQVAKQRVHNIGWVSGVGGEWRRSEWEAVEREQGRERRVHWRHLRGRGRRGLVGGDGDGWVVDVEGLVFCDL